MNELTEKELRKVYQISAQMARDILIPAVKEMYANSFYKMEQEFKQTLGECNTLKDKVDALTVFMQSQAKEMIR